MRAAWIISLMCLAAGAARGGSEPADALLSLLDEIEPIVSDANSVPETNENDPALADAAANQDAQPAAAPAGDTADLTADPNLPVASAEPNTVEPVINETEVNTDTPEDAALEKSRQLRREFYKVQLEPVKTMSSDEREQNLDALIARLNSLEPSTPLTVVPEKPADAEAAEPDSADQPAEDQPAKDAAPAAAPADSAAISEPNAVQATLLARLETVEQVVDAIQLADVLYRQGYTQAAYTYYSQAAKQAAGSADNDQWVLFQMANCCGESDPAKAVKLYSDLLARYPNSPWSGAAQARRTTLEWSMKETVQQFAVGGADAVN